MNTYKQFFFFTFLISFLVISANNAVFHRYLWANYNHFSGNLNTAHDWYKTLISSHCSPYAYKGYLTFLFDTNQESKIVELLPTVDKKFENDPEMQLLFAIALDKNKQHKQAEERLVMLSNKFKANSEITLRTVQIYVRRKEPENALLTIDTFLNNSPRKTANFIFYFLKSQIHLQLNQLPHALEAITVCLDMHPRFGKGWLVFATLQEQQGEVIKAMQGYDTFLELSGDNNTVEQHLFSLLLKHKSSAQHMPFYMSYFKKAESAYHKKDYRLAASSINKHLALEPEHYESLLLKVHALSYLSDYEAVANTVSTLLQQPNSNMQLWAKNIYLLHHHGMDKEKLVTLLQSLSKQHSATHWFSLYAADLCIRSKKTVDALALLKDALSKSSDNALQAKIYHQLGLLSYETQDYPAMIDYLEKGHALNNNCVHLNNSLAYYWATKGKNIQKAEEFMKTIDAHTTNPCFLDTQALIFYKQKEYKKAQEILEPLQNHQNALILLHLAKTYFKLQDKDKALAASKQASNYITYNYESKKLHNLQQSLASSAA